MCTDGGNCKRRVCFFAHTEGELRKPEEDPAWLQQQLQAEVVAGEAAAAVHCTRQTAGLQHTADTTAHHVRSLAETYGWARGVCITMHTPLTSSSMSRLTV
jgi:hypothetical protein